MDPTRPTAPTLDATDNRERQMPSTEARRGRRRAVVVGCLVVALATTVGGVVLLTGGGNTPDAAPAAPPAPAPSRPTTAPPVNVPVKPADVAAAEATSRYREYLRVRDEVSHGRYKNTKLYDSVAISPERTQLLIEARQFAGLYTKGNVVVASLSVQSVKLSTDPRVYPQVHLLACLDGSGVGGFNPDGTSAVSRTRLPRIKSEVVLWKVSAAQLHDTKRTPGWYVTTIKQPGQPC